MIKKMHWFWIQLLLFQCLWFIAVIGQNQWLLAGVVLLVLHFIFSNSRTRDWRVLPIAVIGMIMDALLTQLGVFEFNHFPFWLGLLWVGFILSLGHSLNWLNHLPRLLLIPIGAIAGTLSYLAGWKLDAVGLPMGVVQSITILAISWGMILPLLAVLNERIRRVQ